MGRSSIRSAVVLLSALVVGTTGCHVLDYTPRFAQNEIAIFDDLFAVSVVDEDHAVAVGYHGSVYFTADGGEGWKKGLTPTNRLLYSVSMADTKYGWAVGQLGTIVHTEDGGATWKDQPNLKQNEGSHLFGIHAIDARRAWAVGEWGTFIYTSDGGANWVDHSLGVDMLHPMFVWLSESDQAKVRRGEKVYEDVGLNYVTCLPQPSQKCWAIGEFGYIFRSDDLGQSWERGQVVGDISVDPVLFGFNEISVKPADRQRLMDFASRISNETHLNILIEPYASGREVAEFGNPEDPTEFFDILSARIAEATAIIEEAGVLSDRLRMPNKPPWDYEDFLEDDPAFLQRYIDGRTAETPVMHVSVIQNPYLFTVHFADEDNGLIAGLGGVVLRSTDGGRTWRYQATDRKQAFFSVASANGRAIAVGEKGLVRQSVDGGVSWKPPEPGNFPTIFTFMRDLAFDHNQRTGFIVGQNGMVLRTRDSGVSWNWVLPPKDRRGGA